MQPPSYFRLFSACIPVQGVLHALLFDLERKSFYKIPNLLAEILDKPHQQSIPEIKAHYEHQYDEGIDTFLKEFESKELGLYTDEPEAFPKLDMYWDDPLDIQTAVVEMENTDAYNLENVLQQLDDLGCAALQLRLLSPITAQQINTLLKPSQESRLRQIELLVAQFKGDAKAAVDLMHSNRRISLFVQFNKEQKQLIETSDFVGTIVHSTKALPKAASDCVSPNNFTFDVKLFSEAHSYNTALNRKVCIDAEGYIRNYLSHPKAYGHISNKQLTEVVQMESFREKWLVHNDQIEICKDCPYRYVCLFNSDLQLKNHKWHKTERCGYDPYTDQWQTTASTPATHQPNQ